MAKPNDKTNDEMLSLLAKRGQRQTLHGHGIRTAADYVRGMIECVEGDSTCAAMFGGDWTADRDGLLKDARSKLTYSNEEMVHDEPITTTATIREYCKAVGAETPANTLMVFENIVTTPKRDRDEDILRTQGAIVDPAMPLLWHHMLPMVAGKMIKVLQHNSKRLKVATALIDSSLGADAAELVEFGALRISHGFRPIRWEEIKSKDEEEEFGFDIKEFEIMEESLVSVPSNTDAVITAFSRGKLHDPLVKVWAKRFNDGRKLAVPGVTLATIEVPLKITATVPQSIGEPATDAQHDPDDCCGDELIVKEGRVLSKANEARLEKAIEMLTEVLEQVRQDEAKDGIVAEEPLGELARKVSMASVEADGQDVGDLRALADVARAAVAAIERRSRPPKKPSKLSRALRAITKT